MYSRTFFRVCGAAVLCSALLALSLLPAATAFAQTEAVTTATPVTEASDRMMCLSLYDPASLSATIGVADDATAAPGDTISGAVSLSYSGDTALYGMNVYVAVMPSESRNDTLNTPHYFAQVAEDVVLEGGFSENYSFAYDTPINLTPDSYQAAVYVMQQDEATAMGLVAYGREPLATSEIAVAGDVTPFVTFGDSFTIDGEAVDTSSYYLLASTDPLTAAVTATNESDTIPAMGMVTFELYEGMVANPHKLVASIEDEIRLMPGGSRTAEFELQHVIENPQQTHNVSLNSQLDADSYVLRVVLEVDGEVLETFSYPLVQNTESLLTDEPILEYVQIDPETKTANACVSYVEAYFDDAHPSQVIEIEVTATQAGSEVSSVSKTFQAGEYQELGADEFGLSTGLYEWIDFSGIEPGAYELTATLSTGVEAANAEAFALPKEVKQEVASVSIMYECPADICTTPDAIQQSEETTSQPSSQMLAIGVLVSLVALIIVVGAVRTLSKRKQSESFDDTMKEFTDMNDDGLGESNVEPDNPPEGEETK